jgi:hypothetical protein
MEVELDRLGILENGVADEARLQRIKPFSVKSGCNATYCLILLDGASNCDAHKKKTRAEEGIHDDHFTIGHRAWRRAGRHQGRKQGFDRDAGRHHHRMMTLQPQTEYQP